MSRPPMFVISVCTAVQAMVPTAARMMHYAGGARIGDITSPTADLLTNPPPGFVDEIRYQELPNLGALQVPKDEVQATQPGAGAISSFRSPHVLDSDIRWAESPSYLSFPGTEPGEYGFDFVRLRDGSYRGISHVARELAIDSLERHVGHTSLSVEGEEVVMAGELFVNQHDKVVRLTNTSGHYRPSEDIFQAQTGRAFLSRASLEVMRGREGEEEEEAFVSVREYDQYLPFRVHEISDEGGSFLPCEISDYGGQMPPFCGDKQVR